MTSFGISSGRACTAVPRPSRTLVLSAATPARPVFAVWITNPLTAAAFCPRLWAGTLVKGREVVSELADSVSEIASTALADSSMTAGEKSETVANIVNKQLDSLLIRGAQVETEVFNRLDAVIDTSFIRPDVPQPLEPLAEDYTTNHYNDLDSTDAEAVPTMPTSESRTSSALLQLQEAIANVQASLAEIESNDTPSKVPMLKLNMREAWEALKMRVAELESSPVEGVESALEEAKGLVTELGEAFKFS